jgi:serine/threonine-protein kinase HipA
VSHLLVLMDGRRAGTLTRLARGALRFTYDDEYANDDAATPLSVSMSLALKEHPSHVVDPWLWGLLPDDEKVLARWGAEYHASPKSAFSLLSTPVGHDCAGAVQFVAPTDADDVRARPDSVEWLSTEDVAARLKLLRTDATAWLGASNPGQFSLAGAQAKTALLLEDGRWGVPRGTRATTHILKPAVPGLADQELNGHLCLDAARRTGMLVARSSVQRFGDERAIVVQRYDRLGAGGAVRRVHQEDLCQSLGVAPDHKYEREGGPGVARIARLLRQTMSLRAASVDLPRFAEALAWNWLIGGTDAHAKNYSLLLSGRDIRLAPLYDNASALPYFHERELKLATKLGGDYRVSLWADPWPRAATDLGMDPDALREQVLDLARRAPDAFADAARHPSVTELDSSLPARLTDLIADRVSRCERLLSAP